jgi:probable F420-dependent oxidoreductase
VRRSLLLVVDPIAEMVELARLAEAARFERIWDWEFFNKNAYVRLAAIACATSSVELGTGIAMAFTRSPLLTASAAADLDELAGGRMVLGLGTGTKRMNEDWYATPFEHPAPKLAELCQLLRQIWRSDRGPLSFQGRFYQIAVPHYSRPGQARASIPIYLAAVNPLMIRTIAQVADGLVGHPIHARPYLRDHVGPAVDRGLRRAGRARASFDLASCVIASVSNDREQARQEARQQIAFYSTVKTYDHALDSAGFSREKEAIRQAFRTLDVAAMAAAVSDDMLAATAIAGTPDDCRQQLAAYEGLIDQAMLYTPTFGVDPQRAFENHRLLIEVFGSE